MTSYQPKSNVEPTLKCLLENIFYKERTSVPLELKVTKNMYIKGKFPLAFLVQFCTMNNYEELQPLPFMEFSFNTLPR